MERKLYKKTKRRKTKGAKTRDNINKNKEQREDGGKDCEQ